MSAVAGLAHFTALVCAANLYVLRTDHVFLVRYNTKVRKMPIAAASTTCGFLFLFLSAPLLAQELPWPSNADTHPGDIVYSRDVPEGSATRRFERGEASIISPGQSQLINNSLLLGLQPISDADAATFSAPLVRSSGMIEGAIATGLAPIMDANRDRDFNRLESGGIQAGEFAKGALGVLPSALSVIGRAVGGGG